MFDEGVVANKDIVLPTLSSQQQAHKPDLQVGYSAVEYDRDEVISPVTGTGIYVELWCRFLLTF